MWSPQPPPLPLQLRRPTLPLLHQGCRRRSRRLNRIAASQEDPLTALSRVLWGRALPPSQLVLVVRHGWTAAWRLLMRQLAPSDPATGGFTRTPSRFPTVVAAPSPGSRLHLYVGLPCPWAHRALVVRALLGLDRRLPVSVAVPGDDGAWSFTPDSPDALYGKRRLRDVYAARRGGFEGRASVPMLWDADRREVVCNESIEIAKFLCTLADADSLDLWPLELRQEIDRWYGVIYPSVNNGVYRCGFAQSQAAYDTAAGELFAALDMLEDHLSKSRYLCAAGSGMTLADVCLFTTLIRFDLVYNPLFRCSRRKLVEYPSLHAYTREIYQMPGVAETCDMAAIADGYFGTLFPLNPGGIQPVVPASCDLEALIEPHGREAVPSGFASFFFSTSSAAAQRRQDRRRNDEGYREFRQAPEQDPHAVHPLRPPQLPPAEEHLLLLRLPRRPHPQVQLECEGHQEEDHRHWQDEVHAPRAQEVQEQLQGGNRGRTKEQGSLVQRQLGRVAVFTC